MIPAQLATAPRIPDGSVQAVHLVRDPSASDPTGHSVALPTSLAWLFGAVLFLAIVMMIAAAALKRRREDPLERALRRLCGLLRLTRAERELLKSLAATKSGEHGQRSLHPAALLMSQSAFIRAAGQLDRAAASFGAIIELHRKVFEAPGG
jgi:hypothetical protein